MISVYTDRLLTRLHQLLSEIETACSGGLDYHDRLREFKSFCEGTPLFRHRLDQLPPATFDFRMDFRDLPDKWRSGAEGYAMRWSAIRQMVEGGPVAVETAWIQTGVLKRSAGLHQVTRLFIVPLYHFLVYQVESFQAMLYVLLRYKRWAEWFKAARLRELYHDQGSNGGEAALDTSLRRFLFESGIDYPFSQPASPHGRADIVARLESDDALVLEIKVWDSTKGYGETRIRDGLRQVMDYADKYGKDRGYVVVFNLDREPLRFVGATPKGEWPSRIEHGGRTFFFVDVHIAEQQEPISQRDKGKAVRVNEVDLTCLIDTP